jgi:hypothetical protein
MSALNITSTSLEAAAERAVGKIYRHEGPDDRRALLQKQSSLPDAQHDGAPSWRSVVRRAGKGLQQRWSRVTVCANGGVGARERR